MSEGALGYRGVLPETRWTGKEHDFTPGFSLMILTMRENFM